VYKIYINKTKGGVIMNISAIISEYNPLHKGHVYHIEKTKEITDSDAIICIMSGNYVQRGLPALIDKWNRTKTALECGADLVIELPVIYSLSSAEFFSSGAVSLLNSLGVVNNLSFGSEIGDIEFIKQIASVLVKEPLEFKSKLKIHLDNGTPYPKARSMALIEYLTFENSVPNSHMSEALNSSNNILGIEYCKSLLKLNSSIKPLTIRREGGSYNDENLNAVFSSATSIRKYMKEEKNLSLLEQHMPKKSYEMIRSLKEEAYPFVYGDFILPFIKYKAFSVGDGLHNLPDASEGLHNKIYDELSRATGYDELLNNIKSKRYTYTRISRILSQYFIGFENYPTDELRKLNCPYARVLGFNETGMKVLKHMKKNSEIPVYTKLPRKPDKTMELDIKATQTYSILNSFVAPNSDYLVSPIIIQK
jgi:predicted nucleotidyltransferase